MPRLEKNLIFHNFPHRIDVILLCVFQIPGVPKVRSSNFMHYLYIFMHYFIFTCTLSSTCIQNFSNWYALFGFLSHTVAVAA